MVAGLAASCVTGSYSMTEKPDPVISRGSEDGPQRSTSASSLLYRRLDPFGSPSALPAWEKAFLKPSTVGRDDSVPRSVPQNKLRSRPNTWGEAVHGPDSRPEEAG